jgi:hypothetical protein
MGWAITYLLMGVLFCGWLELWLGPQRRLSHAEQILAAFIWPLVIVFVLAGYILVMADIGWRKFQTSRQRARERI